MRTTRLLRDKKQRNIEKSRISYKKTQRQNTTRPLRDILEIKILEELELILNKTKDRN